ncbi:hypothetical protein HUB98_03995 [Paenibacillus barcinonensis]|uniref:Uncharacterized protein n=1 Tax=Paenibacillus barcinonensis TaxID=198119 RepID=A0A2V4VRX2_PAEBA|nr:hypothetical protein [Paenibacillus barcinonensis]PYE49350.1 hypothetical protein DFQ00_106336 [Paenibacillus barcinonensis]QKS55560.1 hypothetical protein HUB98_03995 [Paenibacillus barcinonensis]
MNPLLNNVEYKTSAYLFAAFGGATAGAMRTKWNTAICCTSLMVLYTIDSDPTKSRNHDLITGEETSVSMDLFERW